MAANSARTTRSRGSATLHPSQPTARRSAFSLIEIVVALAVISIGLIAVVGLIPQGIQASRDAADNTLAATILQDECTELRQEALVTWPPTSIANLNVYYDTTGSNATVAALPPSDSYYHVHIFLPPGVSAVAASNSLTIVAVVSWPALSASPINNITNVTSIANYVK